MKRPFHITVSKAVVHGVTALVLLLVALLIIAGFVPVKHSFLNRKALSYFDEMGADSCTLSMVELVGWKSVTLKGLYLKWATGTKYVAEVRSAEIVVSVNLIELLMGKKAFARALIKGNDGQVVNTVKSDAAMVMKGLVDALAVYGEGEILRADDVGIAVVDNGKSVFSGSNGKISAIVHGEKDQAVQVDAAFPVVSTLGDGLQDVKSTLLVKSEGTIDIKEIAGRYFDGRLKAHGELTFADIPSITIRASVDKMDLAWWYTVHNGPGKISGRAMVQIKGTGIPVAQILEKSEISAVVNDVEIAGLPLQKSLATSLFLPSINKLMFKKIELSTQNDTGDSKKAVISGFGDQLHFSSSGNIRPDGTLSQHIDGLFTNAYIKTFPDVVRQVMVTGGSDGWKFRCRLYGTYADPRFELDKETLQRALGGMFRSMQQNIMESLLK